jgi:hypothetical protein
MRTMLTVIALTFFVATTSCADDGRTSPRPTEPVKLTVADVLKGLSLDESKLDYIDEPPGKLRELRCEATLRDTNVKVQVRIEVVYTLDLFSDQRKWEPKTIRAATARTVTITPVSVDK